MNPILKMLRKNNDVKTAKFLYQQHVAALEIARLTEENKRLQEQLADASKTIDYYDKKDFHYTLADGTVMGAEPAHKYKIKWGVK